jgi:hypothetical protein
VHNLLYLYFLGANPLVNLGGRADLFTPVFSVAGVFLLRGSSLLKKALSCPKDHLALPLNGSSPMPEMQVLRT